MILKELEDKIKFAQRNLERFLQNEQLPWLLESVGWQLEMALHDIVGFRLAHGDKFDHPKGDTE